MMNPHFASSRSQRVAEGLAIRLDPVDGELAVLEGRVWITRRGDLDDHVLAAGQGMRLSARDRVVIEQWRRDQPALVDWRPLARPGAWLAVPLRVVAAAAGATALGLRHAEAGFAALARRAAAGAGRGRGCEGLHQRG